MIRSWNTRSSWLCLGVAWGMLFGLVQLGLVQAHAQDNSAQAAAESQYYRMHTIEPPEGILLEVGGLDLLPDGRLAVATRRGSVWLIENPNQTGRGSVRPHFQRFARGLHTALGVVYRPEGIYVAQRGELTRLRDRNGDGFADQYTSVYSWPLSGNYCEYSHGPVELPNGNLAVSLNSADPNLIDPRIGEMGSISKWRSWILEITPDGEMTPFAAGMRSHGGFSVDGDGTLFYAENQGGWVGSGYIASVERGDFLGFPGALAWADEPGSPVDARPADLPPPDSKRPRHAVADSIPDFKLPTVWFPHGVMGSSTADMQVDTTGAFGPFEGQMFVGDQTGAKIMRVALETVNGTQQGAVFPFRKGFQSGITRLSWGEDGSLFVGMTDRGWSSVGPKRSGLQRLEWTGRTPFEMKTLRAAPDGFEVTFTKPLRRETATDPAAYEVTSFAYQYNKSYGSPVIDKQTQAVTGVKVSEDRRRVRLAISDLQRHHIHEVKLSGLRSQAGDSLLHPVGYYTLHQIPDGEPLALDAPDVHVAEDVVPSAAPSPEEKKSGQRSVSETEVRATTLSKHQTERPEGWSDGSVRTVRIKAADGLQFDRDAFEVEAGQRVALTLTNPTDLLHNLVIVEPGTWEPVAKKAMNLGIDGRAMDYVPESESVRAHTSILEPGASETIYFVAPEEPGSYTFVCTFPGHAQSMRGTMRIRPSDGT